MDEAGREWSLRDAKVGEYEALFPELAVNLAITDGSGSQVSSLPYIPTRIPTYTRHAVLTRARLISEQFEGRKNYGRVAEGVTGKTKVRSASVIEERCHAKNVGDGLASEIKNKVRWYLRSGFGVEPGTRNQALLLAEVFPKPMRDGGNKTGIWSPDFIFYAYYSKDVLATTANDDFKPFKSSKRSHFRVGHPSKPGVLLAGAAFCALFRLLRSQIRL
jgi:hypothetical protein